MVSGAAGSEMHFPFAGAAGKDPKCVENGGIPTTQFIAT
jgi:hypothetical protein